MRVAQLVLALSLPRIAAFSDSKLIFQSQLSQLQNAAAGAPPPQDSFPHARSTSKFGEILWRANDATRAHDALEALGSNPLATATATADGVLAALESPELVERRISARRDLLTPTRSSASKTSAAPRMSARLLSVVCCSSAVRLSAMTCEAPLAVRGALRAALASVQR